MTRKTATNRLAISAAAFLIAASPALAVQQSVIDAIVADLSARGFDRIEIDIERNVLDVDAYGPGREGDFYYSLDGTLLSVDIDKVYRPGASSRSWSEAARPILYLDDDRYNDHDDWDHDDWDHDDWDHDDWGYDDWGYDDD